MSNKDRFLNRTERLFATILLLQNRPSMSSKDLAEHFGVSRRTVFRDLRALSESGVPLTYAETGGYEILDGYQLPPLMLTAREAATLLTGTRFMTLQPDASLREDADQVALKILSVLPKEIREYMENLQERTVLDPYWLNAVHSGEEDEGRWYEISEAVTRRRSILMEYYVQSRDELTRRTVDPLGLVYYYDHWNLIGFDHLRKDIRNFRLDYIRSLRVLNEVFDPPESFDLAEHLRERGESVSNERIRVRFSPRIYRWARRGIPAQIEEEKETPDGTEVTFYFENIDYVGRWLLRFGEQALVLEPQRLKDLMRHIAASILNTYENTVSTTS